VLGGVVEPAEPLDIQIRVGPVVGEMVGFRIRVTTEGSSKAVFYSCSSTFFHAEAIVPVPFNYPPVSVAPPTRKFQMARTEKGLGLYFLASI